MPDVFVGVQEFPDLLRIWSNHADGRRGAPLGRRMLAQDRAPRDRGALLPLSVVWSWGWWWVEKLSERLRIRTQPSAWCAV